MPTAPTYESPQVTPNALPQARFAAPEMPDIAGKQTQQMATGLMQAGGAAARIALDVQNTANQLRVDDALNQAKEAALNLAYDKDTGFTNLKGINALQRPDGQPLAEEYGGTLKTTIDNIAGSLGNDAQRQAFAQHANDILTSFKAQAIQHEAQEFKTYSLSVSDGVQATALRDIGLNWNNPDAINSAVDRIQAEVYRQGQLLGKSAEWVDAKSRELTSNAHKVALLTALDRNDPAYASAYLKKYADQMNADDILTVQGHITKEMDARVGVQAASDVMDRMQPRIQTGEAERAFNIAVGTESNGRQFDASGKPLTSPKGAVGIAQVMPDTAPEAAKLAGLPWDENRYKTDPAYNKALGLAYFQKQLQDFGGDLQKAYAAYDAGPGAVKKAEQWEKDALTTAYGGDPSNNTKKTWLDFLPKETQDYVAKNLQAFNAGQGEAKRPTFEDIDAALRADPRLADNPTRYKIAREDAQRRFTEATAAIKQRDDETVADAMRGLIQNGGRFSDLPVSLRASIPPDKVDTVLTFGKKIALGDDTTNDWLYNKLASHPEQLATMSDSQFFALRGEFSQSDFQHFADERAKRLGNAAGSNGPGDINSAAIKQGLDERLRMLKIDPTPKDDGGSDAARVGAIRRFVDQYFMTAQREAGKKFTDTEVNQHLDVLFAKNVTLRGWFSDSSGPLLGSRVGDIPGDVKDNLKAAFKRQGIDSPTDAQLLNAYFNLKTVRR